MPSNQVKGIVKFLQWTSIGICLFCALTIISINTFYIDSFQSRSIEASRDEKRRELEEKLAREEAQKFEKLMTEGGHRKRKKQTKNESGNCTLFLTETQTDAFSCFDSWTTINCHRSIS